MMANLFNHLRSNIAERFDLFVYGETHGNGSFQCSRAVTRQDEVEGTYVIAYLTRQRDPLGGEV
jgi:hypothetical protein